MKAAPQHEEDERNELYARLFERALHGVAALTQGLEIRLRICAASEQRLDMIDFIGLVEQAPE